MADLLTRDTGPRDTGLADRLQRLRVPVLVLICLLGVSVTVLLARNAARTQRELVALSFQRDVEDNLTLINQTVDLSIEQVRTLATFIRSARRVDAKEFRQFVLPALRRYPTIHSLAWVPRIEAGERAAFESAASVSLDEPFRIREPNAEGELVPAQERAVYFPLTFIEPRPRLAGMLGYDLASDRLRREAMTAAAEEGRLLTTPPLRLLATPEEATGFIAFMPIYRSESAGDEADAEPPPEPARLLGFAAAAFRVDELVGGTLSYWRQPDLQVYLFDTALPEGEQLLHARHGDPPRDLTVAAILAGSPLHASRQLVVGGRPWLLVSTPTPSYLAAHRSNEPWIVLGLGLTLTGLAALVLWGVIRSTDQMAAFAASREAANAELRERIREREEAEEALAHANRELRQVNADMERFVGAVSHDLKSPLVAAEMLITVMRQAVAKRDLSRVDETSKQIAKACGRMRRIIDDLLEHQRAGFADLRTTAVDLTEVALHVVEDHREESARRGVHIHLQDDMPTIRADRGRVTALLDNLVSNALKYGTTADEPSIWIGTELTADELRLYVRDNGPGIPEEHRDRMWELFQRLSRDDEGTGIGLAIVQRVAEAHGGRAWLECPPADEGGGTAFWVALPRDRVIKAEPRPDRVAPLSAAER